MTFAFTFIFIVMVLIGCIACWYLWHNDVKVVFVEREKFLSELVEKCVIIDNCEA